MLRQLLRKELSLQRSSMYFALAVVMVGGILLVMARQAETVLIPRQLTMGQLVSLLQAFFIAPCLLGIIPLFIGAGLVAEERHLGVWDWQLSLPAPRALQLALKLALGVTLTLTLSHLVLPGLDWAMTKVLAGRGDPFPLLSTYLTDNDGYACLPLLVMACGAFVSSLASDAYKAFFGGALLTGAALLSFCLVDPAFLLLQPWQYPRQSVHIVTIPGCRSIIIALGAILAFLAYFNFRFEGLRWRRLLLEALALIVLANAAAWLIIRADFGIGGLVSNDRHDVIPAIVAHDIARHIDPPADPLAGITPLLVKRSGASLHDKSSRALDFLVNPEPITAIYRLPQTNRAIVELNSFLPAEQGQVRAGFSQIVEVDLASGARRQFPQLIGFVNWVDPERPRYTVNHMLGQIYLISRWPLPLRNDGLVALGLGLTRKVQMQETAGFITRGEFAAMDGRKIKVHSSTPISRTGDYELYLGDNNSIAKTMLVRERSTGAYEVIDEQPRVAEYAVSNDGKWFTRYIRSNPRSPQTSPFPLMVFSKDHTTSWTVTAPEGDLILTSNSDRYLQAANNQPLSAKPDRLLRVSPSGRYLPFMRTQSIVVEDGGRHEYSGYPSTVELALLDLQSGRDLQLLTAPAPRAVREQFESTMKDWLWCRWSASNMPLATMSRAAVDFHRYYPKLPPLAWAPERDKLAILYDDTIQFFDYLPDVAAKVANWKDKGGFVPLGPTIDLHGFEITDFAFWDQDTLLAWGELGLFKIDLKTIMFSYGARGMQPPPAAAKRSDQ